MSRYRRNQVRRLPSRLRFLQWSGASAGLLSFTQIPIIGCGSDSGVEGDDRTFHVALLADTHIIDSFYDGPEGNALVTSEKVWMAGRRVLDKHGFECVDTAPPAFSLMVKKLGKHPSPSFARRKPLKNG